LRLARRLPEVKEKIGNGSISLTSAAMLQGYVTRENKISPVKVDDQVTKGLLTQIDGKSVRESEKILMEAFPHHLNVEPNRIKNVGPKTVRFEVNLNEETFKKLERIRSLRSHVNKGDWLFVISDLCELGLKYWDPIKKMERREARESKKNTDEGEN